MYRREKSREEKNLFRSILRNALRSGECVGINGRWAGFVRALKKDVFIVEVTSQYGAFDGLLCMQIEDVRKIDRETRFLKRMQFLRKARAEQLPTFQALDVDDLVKRRDYCRTLIEAAQSAGEIVSVKLGGKDGGWERVRIRTADTESIRVDCVDGYGQITKNKRISFKKIVSVWYGDIDDKLVEMCKGHTF